MVSGDGRPKCRLVSVHRLDLAAGDARCPGPEFFASLSWSCSAGAGALRAQVVLPWGLPAGPHSLRPGLEGPASPPSPLSVTPPRAVRSAAGLDPCRPRPVGHCWLPAASRYSSVALGSRKGPPSSPRPPFVRDEGGG